jgi:hypothetical protein
MTPPRIARWLLGCLVPPDDRDLFLGDVDEAFEREVARAGRRAANRWYWRQTAASLPALLRERSIQRRHHNAHTGSHMHDALWRTWIADVRYAGRLARRNLGTSLVIVTTVALGVGATTAVFGVVDAVLIRPLPFPASDRVVTINGVGRHGTYVGNVTYPDALDFRAGASAFSDIALFQLGEETLERGTGPQMLRTVQVDDAFERIFSLRPALGRLLTRADMQVSATPVVILSDALWHREFGGDRAVVGTMLHLSGRSVQIVGVLEPPDFSYPRTDLDAITPLVIQPGTMMVNRGAMWASADGECARGDFKFRQGTAQAACAVEHRALVLYARSRHAVDERLMSG